MFAKIKKSDMPKGLIENLMVSCFGVSEQNDYYRFDFAYLFHDGDSKPTSFVTCQEMSREHIWLAFGGTLPEERGAKSLRNFQDMIEDLSKTYKSAGAQVHNGNHAMLKIYMHHKFKITGTRLAEDGRLFCEFFKKIGGEQCQ